MMSQMLTLTIQFSNTGHVNEKVVKRILLVHIHAFCLMPNHYHLLVSPLAHDGVPLFMKKLNGGYAKYFNERYERSGALFQGKYKSVPIDSDRHFSWIPYYIHFNPLDLTLPEWRERGIKNPKMAAEHLNTYRWSSHLDYMGKKTFLTHPTRVFTRIFEGEKGYAKSPKCSRIFRNDRKT